ncbi:unnamed protein product [Amoebophrya sp. A120]|nr:unnamed protein product [Amoebophrya sp. A120]|eukprot:GSA120T00000991001.1
MDLDDIGIPSLVPVSQLGTQPQHAPPLASVSNNPLTGGGIPPGGSSLSSPPSNPLMTSHNPLMAGQQPSGATNPLLAGAPASNPNPTPTGAGGPSSSTTSFFGSAAGGGLSSFPASSATPPLQPTGQFSMTTSAGVGGMPMTMPGAAISNSGQIPGSAAGAGPHQNRTAALAMAEKAGALTGTLVGGATKFLAAGASQVLQSASEQMHRGSAAGGSSSMSSSGGAGGLLPGSGAAATGASVLASGTSSAASTLGAATGVLSSTASNLMQNALSSTLQFEDPSQINAGNTTLYNALPDAKPPEVVVDTSRPVYVKINRTETKLSFLLQEYTDYVIEVHDFGRDRIVNHRFNDFFTLHAALTPLDLNLPVLPQKGMDSTDPVVVEDRKAKLSIFLQYCLNSEVIRLEKQLHIWKFLEFENAGLSVSRFVFGPDFVRSNLFKTLPKLCVDEKYATEVYRLAHPEVLQICTDHILNGNPPECLAQAAQLLTGAVKVGKLSVVEQLQGKVGFLQRLFRALDVPDNFPSIRGLLSAILLNSGDQFPRIMTATLIEAREVILQLLHPQRPAVVHELLAKLFWFALEDDLKQFLFSESGLGLVVALFSSPDRNTQIVACILSGNAIISGACEASRAIELLAKTEEVWAEATGLSTTTGGEQLHDPNLLKLTAALCTHQTSLGRVSTLLIDPRFAKYGLWLLQKANLSMRNLQQISANLTRILEVPDHPCRFQAAELLLNSHNNQAANGAGGQQMFDISSNLDGLPAFEKSLEKAILDPLAVSLDKTGVDIAKMKQNTSWQVDKVSSSFPKLAVGNEHFQAFEKTLAAYLSIQGELKTSVKQNDDYAGDLLRIAENCRGELNLRTFSDAERDQYIKRLAGLEVTHGQAAEQKRDFGEKDGKLQELTQSLQAKQKQIQDLERGLQQLNVESEQKKRLVATQKQMLQAKQQNLGNAGSQDQATQIRQRLEQVQERQKTLAMVHMKVQQGDQLNIDPYLTAAGLAVAAQGRAQQVKVEHAHWKQQEVALNQHLAQLSNFDPRKLQEEVSLLERQINENEAFLLQVDGKKATAGGKLAELKVDFESERHLYTSQKNLRDELMRQAHQSETGVADQLRRAQAEIQQRHEGLSNLMRASKDLGARSGVLETKMQGISRLLESEVEHRQNLRQTIASLGQYLTQLDYDLSQLGQPGSGVVSSPATAPGGAFVSTSQSGVPAAGSSPASATAAVGAVPPPIGDFSIANTTNSMETTAATSSSSASAAATSLAVKKGLFDDDPAPVPAVAQKLPDTLSSSSTADSQNGAVFPASSLEVQPTAAGETAPQPVVPPPAAAAPATIDGVAPLATGVTVPAAPPAVVDPNSAQQSSETSSSDFNMIDDLSALTLDVGPSAAPGGGATTGAEAPALNKMDQIFNDEFFE